MPYTYDFVQASADDLKRLKRELIRETVIRDIVANGDEDRQTVIDFLDAHRSMDEESVLSLTEGEPTTLEDALGLYVDNLFDRSSKLDPDGNDIRDQEIGRDLNALLVYPWPGEAGHV